MAFDTAMERTSEQPIARRGRLLDRLAGAWPLAWLVVVYGVMALILRPTYNWPVIDSWAFAWTVQQLLETGQLRIVEWGAMSLLAHVGWGALFCLPAGFSFSALNLSTFLLSMVAAGASYLALRELSFSKWASVVGAGVVVVNPAVVLLSYSYMTDVPFLAWFTLSTWCNLRGLRRHDVRWLLLGSVFATLAVLIRQNGIVLPAAWCAYLLWQWVRGRRSFPWAEGLASVVLPILALIGLTGLSWAGVLPQRTNILTWFNYELLFSTLLAHLFRILLYLGLFMLPLTIPMAIGFLWPDGRWRIRRAIVPAALFLLLGVGAIVQFFHPFKLPYLGTWRMMPYYPSVWSVFGTGSQEEWLAGTREMVFSYRFWVVITALSCAGAALLLWPALRQAWQSMRTKKAEASGSAWPLGFMVALILTYLASILLFRGEIYERYLIGLLVPVGALVLRACHREGISLNRPAFGLVAIVFLAFSLALTGEFVTWNGAAWQAASRLADAGIPLDQIDGGFAWNGWHFAGEVTEVGQASVIGPPWYMAITPQIVRTYVVSFSPLEGYTSIGRQPYWSPLHWAERELWILHRAP